jgi:hypothetical protein
MSKRPLTAPQLQPLVRGILRENRDGLTLRQVMLKLIDRVPDRKSNLENVRKVLKKMPDTYVDRWTRDCVRKGRYEAVWGIVIPPPDCPPPGTAVQRQQEHRQKLQERKNGNKTPSKGAQGQRSHVGQNA